MLYVDCNARMNFLSMMMIAFTLALLVNSLALNCLSAKSISRNGRRKYNGTPGHLLQLLLVVPISFQQTLGSLHFSHVKCTLTSFVFFLPYVMFVTALITLYFKSQCTRIVKLAAPLISLNFFWYI